jgi:hypothetical protein
MSKTLERLLRHGAIVSTKLKTPGISTLTWESLQAHLDCIDKQLHKHVLKDERPNPWIELLKVRETIRFVNGKLRAARREYDDDSVDKYEPWIERLEGEEIILLAEIQGRARKLCGIEDEE